MNVIAPRAMILSVRKSSSFDHEPFWAKTAVNPMHIVGVESLTPKDLDDQAWSLVILTTAREGYGKMYCRETLEEVLYLWDNAVSQMTVSVEPS